MKQSIFALIDCNNFFVSCERLFRPELVERPVVVLSSNDGCAVSRSNEAKAIGIPMGAPAFKYKQTFRDHGVVAFSANFELYGDMSKRITQILMQVTPRIEVYSVDESFLDLSELVIDDYGKWGRALRARILRETGIPVSVGIAPSKTLAKIATERAKKDASLEGAYDMYRQSSPNRQAVLATVPIKDVWGVGWRLAPKLMAHGLTTAADLAQTRPQLARQLMGIHGVHMVSELGGISCIPLEREHQAAKSISRTRTFGQDTNEPHIIEAAIASFATQAAYRLRKSGQLTKKASIFLTTDRHKAGYRKWTSEVIFNVPTAETGLLISSLVQAFSSIYERNAAYHRAGVLLHDFVPSNLLQTDLLGTVNLKVHEKDQSRMAAVDHINSRFGKRAIRYAAEELGTAWQPRKGLRSPRYLTNWDELPTVKPYG